MKTPPHPALSLVITTYNRSDALLAVLRGLVAQTDRDFEVVVADDGSRPEHVQALLQSPEAAQLKLIHVWHPDVGFTASKVRNRGVKAASGDYIVLMDGDCVPELDFVAQHKRLAQAGCFVNGSRVLLSAELTQQVLKGQVNLYGRSPLWWLGQRLQGHANKLTGLIRLPANLKSRLHSEFVWKGIRSCNMGVWKTDYALVDGFDESFSGWGHEDADFVLRLHHAGLIRKNGFCATEVFHLWHPEAARNDESQNAQTVRQRQGSNIVKAVLGYGQDRGEDDVVITRC